MAVVYSGDASYIISENPELGYYTPQQGTNTWYDAMVITKDCNEVDLAHEFINFMLDDENALSTLCTRCFRYREPEFSGTHLLPWKDEPRGSPLLLSRQAF